MGQRYRVVLYVTSNFEGEPDRRMEVNTIKGYLEGVAGVGAIDVVSVDPVAVAEPEEDRPTWNPEPSTRKNLRRMASKRPKKV